MTFGGELVLRGDEAKRGYKGPLFQALPGDLVISKIRVGQGSFTLVPSTLDHLAVSPEYPIYALDTERIDPGYLGLVLRSEEFLAKLTRSASGNTTKQRISPAYFESLCIPLPLLVDQQRMAAAHAAAMASAERLQAQADRTEAEALVAFEAALGLAAPVTLPDCPVFVARFRNLDRWSHEAALRGSVAHAAAPDRWPMTHLGDVIADLENGWSPKCLTRPATEKEWGVLKLGAVSFGTFDELENKALPSHLSPRPALEVRTGEVLISRANVTRLVGAAAYVEHTREQLMLCDKIFRVVPKAPSSLDLRFLTQVLRTHHVREQIESKLTGTSPTMKNISKPALLSLTFPLPPLKAQKALTDALSTARTSAAALRERARRERQAARSTFEASAGSAMP